LKWTEGKTMLQNPQNELWHSSCLSYCTSNVLLRLARTELSFLGYKFYYIQLSQFRDTVQRIQYRHELQRCKRSIISVRCNLAVFDSGNFNPMTSPSEQLRRPKARNIICVAFDSPSGT
jgi:thermostable 8-oxoguanine DNA glycosylase